MATSAIKELKFPPEVLFKAGNDEYLKVWDYGTDVPGTPALLQFSGSKYDSECRFEVITQPDGCVAIRSLHNGKYLSGNRYSTSLARYVYKSGVYAATSRDAPLGEPREIPPIHAAFQEINRLGALIVTNSDEVDQHALFTATSYDDDKQIVFRHNNTMLYCKLYNQNVHLKSVFYAQLSLPDDFCKLTVDEPVMRRFITGIKYDMDEKYVKNCNQVIIDNQIVTNSTENKADLPVSYTYTYLRTYCFSKCSGTMKTPVEMAMEAAIPFVWNGRIKWSTTDLPVRSLEWGKEEDEYETISGTLHIKNVPPGESIEVTIWGETGSINVPFTYNQFDLMPDKSTKTTELCRDGMFHGTSECYATYTTLGF